MVVHLKIDRTFSRVRPTFLEDLVPLNNSKALCRGYVLLQMSAEVIACAESAIWWMREWLFFDRSGK